MNTQLCPSCLQPLPDNAPQNLCPACLMRSAMAVTEPQARPGGEAVMAELAAAFPQLIIEELIGTGGMGRVYRAQQPHLNRTVALKVLTQERAADPEWLERFSREARALARLSHPHIVQVHDFGEVPMPFLIMEYVDGVNLRQAMQNGALAAREALAIVPKLCDALHYAHEHGVLHRDIKPENILIDTEGRVKLVDFGLAKLRDETALPFTLTQSGAKLGTIAYMAPEQIEKPAEVDHRADIYSLGVVFYEMLTGELPLGRFPSPSEASGVDPRLDGVVLKTLEKKREKRFQDAGEMRTEVENAASGRAISSPAGPWNELNYEYRSAWVIAGWPLVHIAFGREPGTGRMRKARGIIAIGGVAVGGIALGVAAYGLITWGVLSLGLVTMGVLDVGVFASGVISVGLVGAHGVVVLAPVALGVTAVGYIAAGVRAIGVHTAAMSGPIDPLAARIADGWNPLLIRWTNALTNGGSTLLMLMAAYVSAITRRPRGMTLIFLGLSLIAPMNYWLLPSVTETGQNFRQRLAQQQDEVLKQQRDAQWEQMQRRQKLSDGWVKEASRLDSPATRDKALAEILQAITAGDPDAVHAALAAVISLSHIEVDKTAIRNAVRRLLDAPSGDTMGDAVSALLATNYEQADAGRVLALASGAGDAQLGVFAGALGTLSNKDFTGKYGPVMLSLLERGIALAKHKSVTRFDEREVLQPLWGARISPAIEARLIEWSRLDETQDGNLRTGGLGYNVFYFAVSTQANKSHASVQRLLELTTSVDMTNITGRCLWGLPGTVAEKRDESLVAEAVIKLLENRNEGWTEGLSVIAAYAAKEQLPALESLARRYALTGQDETSLQQIIASLKTSN